MIGVVELGDLDRLGAIRDDKPHPKQRAQSVLMEIVGRLPRPRAYISEPTHTPDEQRCLIWTLAYDILTSILPTEGVSIIEPETLRDLALFSPLLLPVTEASDPLWQTLLSCKFVDQVYIPDDGEHCKRHTAMKEHARALGIKVLTYKPALVGARIGATPPRI